MRISSPDTSCRDSTAQRSTAQQSLGVVHTISNSACRLGEGEKLTKKHRLSASHSNFTLNALCCALNTDNHNTPLVRHSSKRAPYAIYPLLAARLRLGTSAAKCARPPPPKRSPTHTYVHKRPCVHTCASPPPKKKPTYAAPPPCTCAWSTSVAECVRSISSTACAACLLLGLWLLVATSSGYIKAWGWCRPIRTSRLWIKVRTCCNSNSSSSSISSGSWWQQQWWLPAVGTPGLGRDAGRCALADVD